MRRRTFDIITSAVGLVTVVVLLVAGGLLMWAYAFTHDEVHKQLAAQEIYFPPKQAFEHPKEGTEITKSMIPSVSQYAGQQLLTGQQAEVWANDFIAVHLSEMPYKGVYAKISEAARAHPESKQLAALEQTSFQGTTLRGMLLDAYAFSVIGTVTFWASIASFSLALILSVLVALGFWHARRTPLEEELLVHNQSAHAPATGGA